MFNLSKEVKITKVAASGSAGTEVVTGAIDMQGFDGVFMMTTIATANAGNYLKGQHDDAVGLGTVADIAGSKVLSGTNGNVMFLDIYKPTKRYVQGSVIRAGANSVLGEIYIIQYKGIKSPVTNVRSGYVGTFLQEPASGTA